MDVFAEKPMAPVIEKLVLSLAGYLFLSLPLIDQAGAEDEEYPLEEIIVTATKREKSLQDVAISMSVMGAEELAKTGSVRLDDVTEFVPNVTLNQAQTLAFGEFVIRGLSTASGTLGLSPGVGVYIDEVYMGRGAAGLMDLADVERVEVLRGPQGTLFGRNTTMGAFSIVSQKPKHEFGGKFNASIGNYARQNANGFVTGPLIEDVLAAKMTLSSQRRDGYLQNQSGPDVNDVDSLSGRLQLHYTPNEYMAFSWSLDGTKDRATGNYQVATLDGEIDRDKLTDKVDIPEVGHEDRDIWGTSLRAEFNMGSMALTSITAYRELEFDSLFDQDGTLLTLVNLLRQEDHEQFSQEIRLASTSNDPLQWVIGFYHYQDNLSGTLDVINGADTIWLLADAAAPGLFAMFGGTGLAPSDIPIPGLVDDIVIANSSDGTTESNAIFGSVTYDLNDHSSVTAGLRHTKEKREIRLLQDISASDPVQTPEAISLANGVGIPQIDDKESLEDDAFSADLNYRYELSEAISVYAKVAHGFKSGGFNVGLTFVPEGVDASLGWDPDMEFEPERVTSYELGWKADLSDGTTRINGALFYADFRNKQETIFVQGQGFSADNAGIATTQGIELESLWAASEGLVMALNLGYTDARYKKFEDDSGLDNAGNRLPRAPYWNLSGSLDYVVPITGHIEATARVDFSYQSDYYADAVNNPDFRTQEFVLLNLRLGLRSADEVWSASLWGKNLLDQERFTGAEGSTSQHPLERHYVPLNPPTYGLDVSYHF